MHAKNKRHRCISRKMEQIPGHLSANLGRWKGKEWYHQRFDGSPFFMHFIAEPELRREARKGGGFFTVHYCFYDEGKADWYILLDDIKRVSARIIELCKNEDDAAKRFLKSWNKDERAFDSFCRKLDGVQLGKLDDVGLLSLARRFAEVIYNRQSSSSVIDGFALGTDSYLSHELQKLHDQASKASMKKAEAFSALTAPVHLSFINQAELSLLKCAKAMRAGKKETSGMIHKHQQKFFWIHNNYVDSYFLDEVYFKEEIKRMLEAYADLDDQINRIEAMPKKNRQVKQKLIKELKVPRQLRNLLRFSEEITHWQDQRKESTMRTTHYFSSILDEIGKRKCIAPEDLKYFLPRDLPRMIAGSVSAKEAKALKKDGVYYWDDKGYDYVHGVDARRVKKEILGENTIAEVDDFRGLTACTGKALGTVKVIRSAKEIHNVMPGDILVAVMTRPDYMPAMRKAAAIVTDEGGVTSHAAIMSRELNIPCIIGTKIATRCLKNGQTVEVNANHGWVRIIKK